MSKIVPPTCPEPEFGRKYWRSLDQLADTPEFREWMEREFPQGASEWTDPVSRRHFVKIMSASFMLAGLGLGATGCRRPEDKVLPFGKMPENYVHGVPQFFATAMPTRGGAIPLVVKSHEGRPTKIEGNALHPDSNGSTDRYTQASILNLYDPDRATRFTQGGFNKTPEEAQTFLSELSKQAQANGGKGLAFLLERDNSPSRFRLQQLLSEKLPSARWFIHEPIDTDIHRRAASIAFGKSAKPYYAFDKAKVILSLDCDFIGSEDDAHNNIRRFAQGRKIAKAEDEMSRLYVVEGLMTLTGANADHRLRVPTSAVLQVAAALVKEIAQQRIAVLENITLPPAVDAKWISACARDLATHAGQVLAVAGYRQPLAVHLMAHAINAFLSGVGNTLLLHEAADLKEGNLAALGGALDGGEIETLVMLGANPAYSASVDLNWATAQAKAKRVIRLGYAEDETYEVTKRADDWHLPKAHYLESWGDALTADGTLVPIQPLISPLFGGVTELEVLARIAGLGPVSAHDIVRETFAKVVGGDDVEAKWRRFLHDGFLPGSAAKPVDAQFNTRAVLQAVAGLTVNAASADKLEVVFHRDYSLDDGRYANNGWLQEMPDPVTKMVWDNAVLVSRKTAQQLGVRNGNLVEITLGERKVRGPIWVQPGMADNSLGVALGYGRTKAGRVGNGVGFSAYAIRTTAAENFAVGATVTKTGAKQILSCTQDHWSLEGRPIIREANLEQYRKHPDFADRMKAHEPEPASPLYPNPFDKAKEKGLHQWGMVIDLNSCVGCQACVLACQSENNIPIVGKEQVRRGREMHWLRIDRYYSTDPAKRKFTDVFKREDEDQFAEWIDDVQVVTQPMLCQHCEAAPCENVCPVNATVHDNEGLNVMVYNRCVGTRYCSNNCPYKVRKFNYFDYHKRPIGPKLYRPPTTLQPTKPLDEWELLKLVKNPDVTVRMRGVMEKCTFCVQRIEQAKIAQKVKAGASGDVLVPDGAESKEVGALKTACQQACPAGAIVFGNLNDEQSRVSQLKKNERNYTVLEFLLTKPRTTYLAKVRNPNPAMPDYHESPLTLEEYKKKMGDPFQEHGKAHGAEVGAGQGKKKGAH
jgi:molybdopterin-containing oxidoreductase family iron-sulfur binding subunit